MRTKLSESAQPRLHVLHQINTAGTTWLRQSDLVFMNNRPYAVLSWSHGEPEVVIELNSEMLKHDRPDDPVYRYEGEVRDPRTD